MTTQVWNSVERDEREHDDGRGFEIPAVPVPPELEQAIGYEGEAHFVAFYWTPHEDEAVYDDGRHGGIGDWDGYLAFIQHPAVAIALQGIVLGDSDNEASSWPILDRETRQLFVARDAHELRKELTRSRRNEEEGG